jgi:methyl-accepting chemotaxis protein
MVKTNVERTLETLAEFADVHRRAITQTNENINALTAQIGTLSVNIASSIDALTVNMAQNNSSMNELKGLMRQLMAETQQQNETAKIQAENVAALIAVVRSTVGARE